MVTKKTKDTKNTEPEVLEQESAETEQLNGLEKLQQQAKESQENYLRAAAELENMRRRHEKMVADVRKFALMDFASAITEVRDCLETAMITKEEEAAAFRDGVALTLRKLVGAMDERHIIALNPDIGAPFDPNLHMAIGTAPVTKEAAADTVVTVVQVGYMLSGRVLRPANVLVAKNVENKPEEGNK